MDNTRKLLRIFQALCAVFVCMFLYNLFGKTVFRKISDPYAGYFVSQAFFAAVVMLAVVILSRTSILHADHEYLRRGWTSAGFVIVL
ncbi:MAG: hypothetical protein IJJ29_01680, partial [Solobacterium sp.]|nr:hypothetical protein [Solobacterium sp.]